VWHNQLTIGEIKLRGTAIGIVRKDANPLEIQARKRQTQGMFEEATRPFAVREFVKAKKLFEQVLKDLPGDLASKSYILRCDRYVDQDLPEDWDGSLDFDFK
jgi:hypothetical protein